MKFAKPVRTALAALILSVPMLDAQAALNAVDPGPYVAAYGFFPKWYQDTEGRALELCLSPAVIAPGAVPGGLGGDACTLLPNPGVFDPTLPMVFPTNFPDESFWFMGDTSINATVPNLGTVDLGYVSNLEAAFGGGDPAVGDQITFARIRIVPRSLPLAGRWTITHPYGTEIIDVTTPGRQTQVTRDIGIGAAAVFTGALKGDIGPFLMDATVPVTGLIPAVNPVTGLTEFYVGDPNTPRPVVGSALIDADGNRQNYLRVQGPSGFDVRTNLFLVMGKVWAGALPTPLAIERSTYSRTATAAQQDVFANAPASSAPVSYEVSTDPGVTTPMADGDRNSAWYGKKPTDPTLPATVTVSATNTANNNTPFSQTAPLVDLVTITSAVYSAAAGTLTVEAKSSDETALPDLTANGVLMTDVVPGVPGPIKTATIPAPTIPPAFVTVTSANGGSDREEVVVLP